MAEKKWGIIGPGRIAEKFAQDLNLVEDGILHAIASRNHERATAFAEKYQVANVFSSYEEMVHSGELDIVYIATPHTFHHAHTLLCLENQVPVLCEKPAAINSQQLQEMIGMAEKKQIFFMEALWTRFIPAMLKVLEIVADGSMGSQAVGSRQWSSWQSCSWQLAVEQSVGSGQSCSRQSYSGQSDRKACREGGV